MTIEATTRPGTAPVMISNSLPGGVRVLAVTARPGQDSADLGGLLYALRGSGAEVSLLCLTRGEAAGPPPARHTRRAGERRGRKPAAGRARVGRSRWAPESRPPPFGLT